MQLPAPFFALGEHVAIDLPGARAAFTTRRGGCSREPYASLNLGFATDDDPSDQAANRAALPARLGSPTPAWLYQVHGTEIGLVEERADADERPRLDGRATRRRDVAPAALGADCLPVAIAGGGAVAVVHAGWRGLAGGVLEAGVRAVQALAEPAPPGERLRIEAAIGPGAGACCYEVGAEVHAAFAADPRGRVGDHLDLAAVAADRLTGAGVDAVHGLGLCTICHPELFFSHRRDGGRSGRQAGLAWLI